MIVVIAIRNLLASRVRTLLVGGILFFGAFLLVVGNSFLDTIDNNMERSLVNSVSGSFQITSSEAKDKLELFSMDSSTKDYGSIANFKAVRAALEAVPNVKAVVPMGLDYAVVATGNLLDRRLTDLRDAMKASDTARTDVIRTHVRRMVKTLAEEFSMGEALMDKKRMDQFQEDKGNLTQATSDDFWASFTKDPFAPLEFLENKIARLMPGEDLVWLQYLGTDLERFRENFDRFEKVDGELVPAGKRGILFNKRFYEEQLKNKTARRLDEIKERLDAGSKFDDCDDCKEFIRLNIGQASSLSSQLDADATRTVVAALQKVTGLTTDVPVELLKSFLTMDAANFEDRYKAFYDIVVPHIRLFSVNVGDTFVLTAFGRGGYVRNVPVKVYGTFRFKGLDKSPVAGVFNLIDLTTFRELYGVTTPEKLAEIEALKAKVGVKEVNRDSAEDELFGEGAEAVEETVESKQFDEMASADLSDARRRATEAMADRVYTQDEIDNGLVINAAVKLIDTDKAAETQVAMESALGAAGLKINVIPWREAAGVVGIMILLFNVVLLVATVIFTVVALIIVNNALMMSTLQRTAEIGTMRAMGAGKGYIFIMIGLEAMLLAGIFGGAGLGVGIGLIKALSGGFPAASDIMQFFAGGTRFVPLLSTSAIMIGLGFIIVSGFFSTLYPAFVATRITPREAMSRQE